MTIYDAIPHRPPFLLVDEVVSIEGNVIRARKRTGPGEWIFSGHFPGFPLMPGVLICEAIVQSGAILIAHLNGPLTGEGSKSAPVLTRISNAKFKQMVRPGDVLEIEASLKEKLASAYFMEGTARVNGKVAVSLEFACTELKTD